MAGVVSCPDTALLERWLLGQVPGSQAEELAGHLEECGQCQARAQTLHPEDLLLQAVRVTPRLPETGDPLVKDLIRRLRGLATLAFIRSEEKTLFPASTSQGGKPASPGGLPAKTATISLKCPACGKALTAKAELTGKKVSCPHCQQTMTVPGGTEAIPQTGPVENPGTPTVPLKSPQDRFDFLAPAKGPGELGWLGPYRVLKVLGTGGMGVVFMAEDPQLKRTVALKVMLPTLAATSAAQRFLREAQNTAALKHDHVVTIYQVGEDRGMPFLAMELLQGEPLDARLARDGRLPVPVVLRIGREMADALQTAHEAGLIHRDIKPANVWLESVVRRPLSVAKKAPNDGPRTTDFRVKILDFGLARAVDQQTRFTREGAIIGTPAYMAPEQALGEDVDFRCDLFSLGCVIYRMSTGELPFKGKDALETLLSVTSEKPQAPQRLVPEIPRGLSDLNMRLLARKPAERPASALEVMQVLQEVENERTSPRTPLAALNQFRPSGRAMIFVGALALFALALAAFFLLRGPTPPPGEFYVEAANEAVAAALEKAGGLKLIDRQSGMEFPVQAAKVEKLPAGTYDLVVSDPAAGLRFSAREFTIQGNTKETLRVWAEEKSAAARVSPFDALRREDLSTEALKEAGGGDPAKAPQDLVGVFGESRKKNAITSLNVSPDGQRIYSTTRDGALRVWETATAKELTNLRKESGVGIVGAALSPDGHRLAWVQIKPKQINLQDALTGLNPLTFGKTTDSSINQLAFGADASRLAAISGKKDELKVLVYDATGGLVLFTLEHPTLVNRLAFSPDGKRLATCAENTVKTWDAQTGRELLTLKLPTPWVHNLCFSPDGSRLAVLSLGIVQIMNSISGFEVARMVNVDSRLDLAFSPNGQWLATAAYPGAPVALWETATGKKLRQWTLAGSPPQVAFAPDGRHLLTGHENGTILVLRLVAPTPQSVSTSP